MCCRRKKVEWIKVSASAQKLHFILCSHLFGERKKSISGKTFSFQSSLNWGKTGGGFRFERTKIMTEKNKLLHIKFQSLEMSLKLNHFPFYPISRCCFFRVSVTRETNNENRLSFGTFFCLILIQFIKLHKKYIYFDPWLRGLRRWGGMLYGIGHRNENLHQNNGTKL